MPAEVCDRRGELTELRSLVARKFPQAVPASGGRLRTGCAVLDTRGGLARGCLTEVCGSTAGSQLILSALLGAAEREGFFLALIDAADAFEPADWPETQLGRLLWVRCREAQTALKAADILVRDGNLPVLLLDLRMVSGRQLRGISARVWHRFHRVIEPSAVVLVIITRQPLVEGASCRIVVERPRTWAAMTAPRRRLLDELVAQSFERGRRENSAVFHAPPTGAPCA